MKKLLVFSDSHGESRHMLDAAAAEAPDLALHLGDGERDLDALRSAFPKLTVLNVRGNCDGYSAAPALRVFSVEGVTVFMCHGHEYNVKWDRDLLRLRYSALERDAKLVLFGHTHRPMLERDLGMVILNPGSVGHGAAPGYAVVTLDRGEIDAALRRVEA